MKRKLNILAAFCLALLLFACGQDKEKSAAESSESSVTLNISAGDKDDGNPIPAMWRPMFRWVANAEVDSMFALFTQGMYFAIQEESVYDPYEARIRLREFYRENRPLSFAYKHNGSSQSGMAEYAIGELATSKTNYRVTMVMQEGRIITMDFELP